MEHACDGACRPSWHSLREALGLAEGHESHEVIHEPAGVQDTSAAQQEADACRPAFVPLPLSVQLCYRSRLLICGAANDEYHDELQRAATAQKIACVWQGDGS